MTCNAPGLQPEQSADVGTYERARMALILRSRRAEHFNTLLFSDPGWDVLLHLFVHEHDAGPISEGELADAAGTGHSTMRRWLAMLMDEQLVEPAAGGWVQPTFSITERGRQSMLELFSI